MSQTFKEWEQDYDSKNYPESDKYFEIAKQLLKKYPVEEWTAKNSGEKSYFLTHPKCAIEFTHVCWFSTYSPETFYKDSSVLKQSHRELLAKMFFNIVEKRKKEEEEESKKKKEQERKQFDEKLAAALS